MPSKPFSLSFLLGGLPAATTVVGAHFVQRQDAIFVLVYLLERAKRELGRSEFAVAVLVVLLETFFDAATARGAFGGSFACALCATVLPPPLRGHHLLVPRGVGGLKFLQLRRLFRGEVGRLADVVLEIEKLRFATAVLDEFPVADARGVFLAGTPEELIMRSAGLFAEEERKEVDAVQVG